MQTAPWSFVDRRTWDFGSFATDGTATFTGVCGREFLKVPGPSCPRNPAIQKILFRSCMFVSPGRHYSRSTTSIYTL